MNKQKEKEELVFTNYTRQMLKKFNLSEKYIRKLYQENNVCPFCNNYEWYGSQIVHHLISYPNDCLKAFKELVLEEKK